MCKNLPKLITAKHINSPATTFLYIKLNNFSNFINPLLFFTYKKVMQNSASTDANAAPLAPYFPIKHKFKIKLTADPHNKYFVLSFRLPLGV